MTLQMKLISSLNLAIVFALAVSLSACVGVQQTSNTQAAPSISELTILSDGDRMTGLIYQAAGAGPHPTVLLLHGYPGNEKNLDVVQALRRQGWNVLFFHYRGAWGSQGEFSFRGAEQDVQAVLAYMRDADNAAALRIDPQKLSIVGHSMGGHMALAGIFDDPQVNCAVTYDGANMGTLIADDENAKIWSDYADTLFMLAGWSGEKAEQEISRHGAEMNLIGRVNRINGRPVFIIAADSPVIPLDLEITPLVEALQATPNSQVHYELIDDDHSFSASRLELIESTAKFLDANWL
jgi:dienelactone hydrolase